MKTKNLKQPFDVRPRSRGTAGSTLDEGQQERATFKGAGCFDPSLMLAVQFPFLKSLRFALLLACGLLPCAFLDAQQMPVGSTNAVAAVDAASKPKKQAMVFENADLRVVLQAMAKQAGMSLILPEDLKGTVTARLVDVPVQQAMGTILTSKGYSLVELDGVFQIKSKDSVNQEPTTTEIYQFANASAKEVKPTVDKLLSKASGANVQLDERSNTLVITDVPSNLTKVLPILKTLDAPTKQVLIEARLLETQRNPTENVGIQWSSAFTSTVHPSNLLVTENAPQDGGGYGVASRRIPEYVAAGANPTAAPTPFTGVNSGLAAVAASLPVVALLSMPELSATLNLLMQDTDTELLGTPKVITADNREAKITISSQEPIPNYTFNQQTASFTISGFEYKDIGNMLTVTPHINSDDFITLDVDPDVSNRSGTRVFPVGGGQTVSIPLIDKRTLHTRVTLKSGNTLALGGLLSLNSTRTYSKVPFLGDIPGLGELFTNRNFIKTKRNLLIFITPTIVSSSGKTGLEDQYDKLKEVDENDRFPYKKNFLGNAKGSDQYRSTAPHDMELSTGVDSRSAKQMERVLPSASLKPVPQNENVADKEEALKKAGQEKTDASLLNPDQLAPRMMPVLRE